MTTQPAASAAAPPREWLGHPRGLAYIAAAEVWERFSYYGMQSLLVLYMVNHLLKPGAIERIAGFATFRGWLEGATGPLSPVALSSQIFGLYVGLVYLTPILGGWLGDRYLGRTRAVIGGAILMAAGHVTMAFEPLFLLALLFLILGSGLLKGNLAVQVGALYARDDPRRTRGYGIYLIAINTGAFAAPLVCGSLGERLGWHWGFGAAAAGMFVGLAVYLSGLRWLPRDPVDERQGGAPAPMTGRDWRAVGGLLLAFIPYLVLPAASGQAYNVFVLWASTNVDRRAFGHEVPVTWFLSLDGVGTMAAVLLAVQLWRRQAARRREPSDLAKLGTACALCAASFAVLGLGSLLGGREVPILVPLLFFAILCMSFAFIDPPMKSITTRYAPAAAVTTMMGLLMGSYGIGSIVSGWFGRFYETLGPTNFWFANAAIAFTGTLHILVFSPLIARLIGASRPT